MKRVLILGTGWSANKLARKLDKSLFDVRMISPSNHFLFTPLLPSTAVGTLEFRSIQEPVRTIPGLSEYYQAKARSLDIENRIVKCEDLYSNQSFDVPYDYLIIATGSKTNTFNTPGVIENEGKDVFFLKHLYHARSIRNRIIECFERASNPILSSADRQALLTFIVVGGGATSCEFSTELADLLKSDIPKWYPSLTATITLIEAGPKILGSFDTELVKYYEKHMKRLGVNVRKLTAIEAIIPSKVKGQNAVLLKDGTNIPFGVLVWSAGLAQVKFVENTSFVKGAQGRIIIDSYLKVSGHDRIFAVGDCAINPKQALPPTANVAEQQGAYLAECFNKNYYNVDINSELPIPMPIKPYAMPLPMLEFLNNFFKATSEFRYIERGGMVSMGFGNGITDLSKSDLGVPQLSLTGFAAFVSWRGAYLTKQLSYQNMILIPMYWFKSWVFGRDISRF